MSTLTAIESLTPSQLYSIGIAPSGGVLNQAAVSTTTFPANTQTITIASRATLGDAPAFPYRRAIPMETAASLTGALTDASGVIWVPAGLELVPEIFGAVADCTGVADGTSNRPIGTDSGPAINAMIQMATALGARAIIPAQPGGKGYKLSTVQTTAYGVKCGINMPSNGNLQIRGSLYHDVLDTTNQAACISNNGKSTARTTNITINFDGGVVYFPTMPSSGNFNLHKFGLALYYNDNSFIGRANTSETASDGSVSFGAFNTFLGHCTNMFVNGGMVGVPNPGTNTGEDGFHIFGSCSKIVAVGLILNSGDDCISLTMEASVTGLTMSDIIISDCIVSTQSAKPIKITCDTTATNCIIKNVIFTNIRGSNRGTLTGGGVAILNENSSNGTVIDNIRINDCTFDYVASKTNPHSGSGQGSNILVHASTNVHFNNCVTNGWDESGVIFYGCTNCSYNGGAVNGQFALPVLNTGLVITSAIADGAYRKFTFSGSPNLSAAAAQISAASTYTNVYDLKYPLLTTSGMANSYNNGIWRIVSVDTTNYTVDVEIYRPGGSGTVESTAPNGATGTITMGRCPDIYVIDSNRVKINTVVNTPQGWTAGFVGGRAASSLQCEMVLTINDQSYGNGITTIKAAFGRYGYTANNAQSGGYGLWIQGGSQLTQPYNHILTCDDFSGLSDSTKGYSRTALSSYANDVFEAVRGVTKNRIVGSLTQSNGTSTFTILGSVSVLAAGPYSGITPAWLRISARSTPIPYSITWDSTSAIFTVTTTSAATAAIVWDYVIAPPN